MDAGHLSWSRHRRRHQPKGGITSPDDGFDIRIEKIERPDPGSAPPRGEQVDRDERERHGERGR